MDSDIVFSKIHEDGSVTDGRSIKPSAIKACPYVIMVAEHYRADGSCKCDDPQEQAMMIREWGYTEADFSSLKKANE